MPETYTCAKCGKVAKTKQALERHAAYHEDERPFSCEVCLQRFKNSDDRGKHYRRLKRDGKFLLACQVCHKHFKSQELLSKHLEILGCLLKQAKQEEVAANSGQPSEASGSLVDSSHAINVGGSSSLSSSDGLFLDNQVKCTCKICEIEFIGTDTLKKHYREVHNDSKRQVCIQCGQTLSSKDSLARHYSIFHQNNYPFQCELCDQKFKIKESLCRHVKFVHKDGGYPCDICQRVFSQPVNLKKHMAMHSTAKEFACNVCGREFRWKQALQKHVMLHESNFQGNQQKTNRISVGSECADGKEIFRRGSCFMETKSVNSMNENVVQSIGQSGFDYGGRDSMSEKTLQGSGQFYQGFSNRFMSTINVNESYRENQMNYRMTAKSHCSLKLGGKRGTNYDGTSDVDTNLFEAHDQSMSSFIGTKKQTSQPSASCQFGWNEPLDRSPQNFHLERRHQMLDSVRHSEGSERESDTVLNLNTSTSAPSLGSVSYSDCRRPSYDLDNSNTMKDEQLFKNSDIVEVHGNNSALKDLAHIITSYANQDDASKHLHDHMGHSEEFKTDSTNDEQNNDIRHDGNDVRMNIHESFGKRHSDSGTFHAGVQRHAIKRRSTYKPSSSQHELIHYKKIRLNEERILNSGVENCNVDNTFDGNDDDDDTNFTNDENIDKLMPQFQDDNLSSCIEDSPLESNAGVDNDAMSDDVDMDCLGNDNVSDEIEHNVESSSGKGKVEDPTLTSRPTRQQKHAPKLVFKPSSIQRILSGKNKNERDSESRSENSDDENLQPDGIKNVEQIPVARVQSVDPLTLRRSHNPFLIVPFSPNSEFNSATRSKENGRRGNLENNKNKLDVTNDNSDSQRVEESSNKVPNISGAYKFSLVKHMLSLQNEENFDKAIFQNPLYILPADIKGLGNLVERHKVENTDGLAIDTYDLSAKHGFPFQWLGIELQRMSKAQNKVENDGSSVSSNKHEDEKTHRYRKSSDIRDHEKLIHETFDRVTSDNEKLKSDVALKPVTSVSEVQTISTTTEAQADSSVNLNEKPLETTDCSTSGLSHFRIIRNLVKKSKNHEVRKCLSPSIASSVLKNPFATDVNQTIKSMRLSKERLSVGENEIYENREAIDSTVSDFRSFGLCNVKSRHLAEKTMLNEHYGSESEQDLERDNSDNEGEEDYSAGESYSKKQNGYNSNRKELFQSSIEENRDSREVPFRNENSYNVGNSFENSNSRNQALEVDSSFIMTFNKNLNQLNRLKVVPDIIQSTKDRINTLSTLWNRNKNYQRETPEKGADTEENITQELNNVLCSSLDNELESLKEERESCAKAERESSAKNILTSDANTLMSMQGLQKNRECDKDLPVTNSVTCIKSGKAAKYRGYESHSSNKYDGRVPDSRLSFIATKLDYGKKVDCLDALSSGEDCDYGDDNDDNAYHNSDKDVDKVNDVYRIERTLCRARYQGKCAKSAGRHSIPYSNQKMSEDETEDVSLYRNKPEKRAYSSEHVVMSSKKFRTGIFASYNESNYRFSKEDTEDNKYCYDNDVGDDNDDNDDTDDNDDSIVNSKTEIDNSRQENASIEKIITKSNRQISSGNSTFYKETGQQGKHNNREKQRIENQEHSVKSQAYCVDVLKSNSHSEELRSSTVKHSVWKNARSSGRETPNHGSCTKKADKTPLHTADGASGKTKVLDCNISSEVSIFDILKHQEKTERKEYDFEKLLGSFY